MATDTNVIALTGRLVKSMEIIHTPQGYAIGNFTIAVNRARRNKDGNWEDKASFIDCSLLGNSADNLSSYLVKGKQVSISGYIEQDRWEKDGQKFSRIRIICQNLVLIGGQKQNSQQPQDQQPAQVSYSESPVQPSDPYGYNAAPQDENFPF